MPKSLLFFGRLSRGARTVFDDAPALPWIDIVTLGDGRCGRLIEPHLQIDATACKYLLDILVDVPAADLTIV